MLLSKLEVQYIEGHHEWVDEKNTIHAIVYNPDLAEEIEELQRLLTQARGWVSSYMKEGLPDYWQAWLSAANALEKGK